MSGILAGRAFQSTLDGDSSLRSRPMSRVLTPLTAMGASVDYKRHSRLAPFSMCSTTLRGIVFDSSVASAQVQTALLLAGLQAEGETVVKVPAQNREHTLRTS